MKQAASRIGRRNFLQAAGVGLAAVSFGESRVAAPAARVTGGPEADAILHGLRPPVIPPRHHRVTDFGGQGDGHTDARPAFVEAIRRCNADGGGRVRVPAGTWRLDGPLHLKSGVELHLEDGATLRFNPDPKLYLPPVLTRFEGTEVFNYSPCIYAYQASNVAITGRGTIDGSGGAICTEWRKQQRPDRDRLRQMGADGVPVFQRVFGEGHWLRFGLIQFFGCSQVLLEDFSVVNSAFWCVHTVASQHITVRRLRVDGAHLNNDCFDPESSSDVLIEDCVFKSGDDCIAIKSGRDQDAWRVGRPSENIVIRNCELHSTGAAAIAIGSEMSGGVRGVFVENCRVGHAREAINIKGNLDRGGTVEQVRVRGVTVDSADRLIQLTLDYQGLRGGGHPPRFQNCEFTDLRCREAGTAITALAVPGAEFADIRLRDITVDRATTPFEVRHVRNFSLQNVRINGAAATLPPPKT